MSSTAAVRKRYRSVAASVRRAQELDVGSAALVLAAQQLMCTIPLLVVLSAIRIGLRVPEFMRFPSRR